jgi:cyclopropane fatty-acyl-phospholipid synthase-like methyltransferase
MDKIFKEFLKEKKSILEIGCGGSLWLPYFKKMYDLEISGIDYSDDGIELSKKILKLNDCDGELYKTDFTLKNNNLENKFDYLVSFGVVEHFDNLDSIFLKLQEYLLVNGKIITIIPNFSSYLGNIQKIINKKVYEIHNIYTLEDLVIAQQNCGMKILYKDYVDFFDLSVINFDSLRFSKEILRLITVFNFGLSFFNRFNLFGNKFREKLSSYIVTVAEKQN